MPTTAITPTMKKPLKYIVLITLAIIAPTYLHGQFQQGQLYSQQFRLAEGLIRIAEPGELADTINVWGDVALTGRYIVPRGTSITNIISYARGPIRTGTGEADLDRAEFRIEVVVSRSNLQGEKHYNYSYNYEEALPHEFRSFILTNGDLLYLQVRRKPTFRDYITLVSPSLTLVLTAILLYDRVTQ